MKISKVYVRRALSVPVTKKLIPLNSLTLIDQHLNYSCKIAFIIEMEIAYQKHSE